MNQPANNRPKAALYISSLLKSLDLGISEYYVAIKDSKEVIEIAVDPAEAKKELLSGLTQRIPNPSFPALEWNEKKDSFGAPGGRVFFYDLNLYEVSTADKFIFRRFDKAREYAGLEFSPGEEGAKPLPPPSKKLVEEPEPASEEVQAPKGEFLPFVRDGKATGTLSVRGLQGLELLRKMLSGGANQLASPRKDCPKALFTDDDILNITGKNSEESDPNKKDTL